MKPQSPDTVPTDVYLSFVSSLFGNRKTLFTGVFVHILTYVIVFLSTGAGIYLGLCRGFCRRLRFAHVFVLAVRRRRQAYAFARPISRIGKPAM